MCIYNYVCIHMHVFMYVCMYVCMYIYIYIHTHSMHIAMRTVICLHANTCKHATFPTGGSRTRDPKNGY